MLSSKRINPAELQRDRGIASLNIRYTSNSHRGRHTLETQKLRRSNPNKKIQPNYANKKKAPQMRDLLYSILVKYYFKVAGQGLPALDLTLMIMKSP
jgi:hypothetical protein